MVATDVDHGPSCQVEVDDIPPSATLMAVSIVVANTDFGGEDEYVSGVGVGGHKIGGRFLEVDGEDANCDRMSRILDEVAVPAEVEAAARRQGKLSVSINTSRTVNCCPCNGYALYAEVVVTWHAEVSPHYNPTPVDGWSAPAFWDEYYKGEEKVQLQFSLGTLAAGIGAAHFQDLPAGIAVQGEYSASFAPHEFLNSEHLRIHSIASEDPEHGFRDPALFTFRLSMVVGGRRLYGPQSNHIIVLPQFLKTELQAASRQHTITSRPAPIGSMIVATWHSDVYRVLRVTPAATSTPGGGWQSTKTSSETPLGHFVTSQIRQGATALDSTQERLFAIVEPLECDPLGGEHELLVVDVRQPGGGTCRGGPGDKSGFTDDTRQLRRVRVQVDNVSLWNVEYDEQAERIIAVALRGAHVASQFGNMTAPNTSETKNVTNSSEFATSGCTRDCQDACVEYCVAGGALDEATFRECVSNCTASASRASARAADDLRTQSPSTLVSIDIQTGHVTSVAELPAPPVLAVSALSRVERVYYYVDAATHDIGRVKLPSLPVLVGPRPQQGHDSGKHLPPIRLQSSSGSGPSEHIIAMVHTEFQDLIYALQAPWPLSYRDAIALAIYNPRRSSLQARYITSLSPRSFAFGALPQVAFKISEGQIGIFAATGSARWEAPRSAEEAHIPTWEGTHTIYEIGSNTTTTLNVSWLSHSSAHPPGRPVFFGPLDARYPEISAIATSPMPPQHLNSTLLLTITGANFGLRDVGQVVRVGGIDCVPSDWISDYAMTCKMPDFSAQDTRQATSALMAAGSKVNLTVHVPQADDLACSVVSPAATALVSIETWDRISPSSSSALGHRRNITISGRGFHEPYAAYRCVFSTDNHAVMSGAPLAAQASLLVFEQPLWIASAARTSVSVRRISTHADFQIYTPDSTVHFAGAPHLEPYELGASASGLKWEKVGALKPTQGRELSNPALSTALEDRIEFTPQEWEALGISDLRPDDFIRARDFYFRPSDVLPKAQGSAAVFAFQDGYEKISASSASCLGGKVITVTGAGFVTGCSSHNSDIFLYSRAGRALSVSHLSAAFPCL